MEKEKQISLSFIRVIATMCVVMLHTCYMAVSLYGNAITRTELTVSMCVTHLCMIAIPCFIMITGSLLLDPQRELSIEKILRKYVFRILMALILFSLIYKVFDVVMSGGAESFDLNALKGYFTDLLSGSGWSHLWYLYMLIALYLLTPAFRCITREADDVTITYLVIVGFLFMCILPLYRKLSGIPCAFYVDLATVYPVYYLAGYAIRKNCFEMRWCFPVLITVGVIGIITASIFRYGNGNEMFDAMLGYSSPFTFIASVGAFGMLSSKESYKDPVKRIIQVVDPLTFGIYLIHIIILRLTLRYMQLNPYAGNMLSVIYILAIAFMAFVSSILITVLLKKIPGIKHII